MILTEAVLAPWGIPAAPYAKNAKPIAKKNKPIAYLFAGFGLYLLSHHLENNGANAIINSEFKIKNQVAGIWISFSFFFTIVAAILVVIKSACSAVKNL